MLSGVLCCLSADDVPPGFIGFTVVSLDCNVRVVEDWEAGGFTVVSLDLL